MTVVDGNVVSAEMTTRIKIKVWFAKNRPTVLKALRCRTGRHNPPHDTIFEEMGGVMIGGPCTHCDYQGMLELAWVGNAWDVFPDAELVMHESGAVSYTPPHDGGDEVVDNG